MIVIGDVVGDRSDLRFQARPAVERERPFRVGLGERPGGLRDRPVMLGQPLQHLPAQIESRKARIGAFQPGQQPDGMGVVIEAAGGRHRRLKRVLAGMAEGRMADIVGEAERLGQILVEAERTRHRPPDLRDFEAVGEANPDMIAAGRDEDLGLVPQAPERHRMDDPVAVALEGVARPPIGAFAFRVQPASAPVRVGCEWSEVHWRSEGGLSPGRRGLSRRRPRCPFRRAG